jgi:hypothetical protein
MPRNDYAADNPNDPPRPQRRPVRTNGGGGGDDDDPHDDWACGHAVCMDEKCVLATFEDGSPLPRSSPCRGVAAQEALVVGSNAVALATVAIGTFAIVVVAVSMAVVVVSASDGAEAESLAG